MDTNAIQRLTELDLTGWIVTLFLILSGIIAAFKIIEQFSIIINRPFKWIKKKNEDHELLMKTIENVDSLSKKHDQDIAKSNNRDHEIRDDLKQLKDMFLDSKIDTMRWEINDFANRVVNKSRCNKDSYVHCIHVYEKYEKLLKENGLQNGEVEISIKIIKDSYEQKLKEGF